MSYWGLGHQRSQKAKSSSHSQKTKRGRFGRDYKEVYEASETLILLRYSYNRLITAFLHKFHVLTSQSPHLNGTRFEWPTVQDQPLALTLESKSFYSIKQLLESIHDTCSAASEQPLLRIDNAITVEEVSVCGNGPLLATGKNKQRQIRPGSGNSIFVFIFHKIVYTSRVHTDHTLH